MLHSILYCDIYFVSYSLNINIEKNRSYCLNLIFYYDKFDLKPWLAKPIKQNMNK